MATVAWVSVVDPSRESDPFLGSLVTREWFVKPLTKVWGVPT